MDTLLGLNGEWVGQGIEPSSATWQLHVDGRRALLAQFNEDPPQQATRYACRLSETPFAFTFGESCEEFIGIALDMHYIVIAGLDDGNDVIFSRPGLAELLAQDAYADADLSAKSGRFSLSRWAAT